ncbi:Tim44 domain-containing protein [Pararhizobium sp.]|uniref:Tim44 domain-containing protein n=1 Tax=Pararhizobium sp. TaxID=1977563 RepID=UPI00271E2EC1|nr:Tim44 domain-containing protein [Pararhizobium sp.]MDO9416314.1 Tim44 domain-containing protein [Pararhizobium sp.]
MQGFGRVLALVAVGMMLSLTVVDLAEARRAGSGFGSRGTRTFTTPQTTRTAPGDANPITQTMTPRNGVQQQTPAGQTGAAARRPGLFGGFGGSMLGGLVAGGLIGMLIGNGLGGGIGFLGLLLQMALLIGVVTLAMRFFARRQEQPAQSGSGVAASGVSTRSPASGSGLPSFTIPRIGGALGGGAAKTADEIGIKPFDLDRFETLLKDVQAAYAGENYAELRRMTTPEAMSYLAEELSDNATRGLKNEVRDVHLVQGDVAESWREGNLDYATVAMRYESIDVVRERATGRVVEGDPDKLTEAVELWTFVRKPGSEWQVSAIQGVSDNA